LNQAKAAMVRDIREQKLSPDGLRDMLEKNLEKEYGASRDTVRKARKEVLSEINSRQKRPAD
jgi:DNA-binding GntR family transcriptional regulator